MFTTQTSSSASALSTLSATDHLVLRTLFELAQSNLRTTTTSVAMRTSLARPLIQDALTRLDRAGLVDAERCRLTMTGLVMSLQPRAAVAGRVGRRSARRAA